MEELQTRRLVILEEIASITQKRQLVYSVNGIFYVSSSSYQTNSFSTIRRMPSGTKIYLLTDEASG